MRLEIRCPVCGGARFDRLWEVTDRLLGKPGLFTILRCCKCRLLKLHPAPDDSVATHRSDKYLTRQDPPRRILPALRRKLKKTILFTRCGHTAIPSADRLPRFLAWGFPERTRYYQVLFPPPQGGRRLLDIGCGSGMYLSEMSALGWHGEGTEMSQEDCRTLSECGITIHLADPQTGLPKNRDGGYDLITVHHVIEHLPDPFGCLFAARKLLRPGGSLALTTPNASGFHNRLFRQHSFLLEPPRHLHLFSPLHIRRLAERAGFHVRRLITFTRTSGTYALSARLRRGKKLDVLSPVDRLIALGLYGMEKALFAAGLEEKEEIGAVLSA